MTHPHSSTSPRVIYKTFQARAYTNTEGYARLDDVLIQCARLYNAALEEWRTAYKQAGVRRTLYDQQKELTGIRTDDPEFWGAMSLEVGRGVLKRLDRARQAFFRRVKACWSLPLDPLPLAESLGALPPRPQFRATLLQGPGTLRLFAVCPALPVRPLGPHSARM